MIHVKMKERPFLSPCRWLLLSLILSVNSVGLAQNLICKSIPAHAEVLLDSVAVEPGSVTSEFTFTYDRETQLIQVAASVDSVEVCYRILSDMISRQFSNRDIVSYEDASLDIKGTPTAIPIEKEELFDFGGIEKYGAITRGVSFGNRQSVFVNSTLNLQMNGQVTDNLYVSAVITDQNIPYQPEGNTQQIRDFDNVFIKLYNDNLGVTAGDIVLNNHEQSNYFLKYHKNVQGLQVTFEDEGKWRTATKVSGAVSKGKFASVLIPSIEGLNGPYRLRGPNGERFIIVLADSEKVFLDGKQMARGFDRDYIIDYNLGEITFNNHVIITRFSRLRVDFEYAEQVYSRSNIALSQTIEKDNVRIYSNFYRERDNPNSNLGFTPDQNDLDLLQNIGDQTEQAFIQGVAAANFEEGRILYRKADTLDLEGNPQQILVHSTGTDGGLFTATFSDVGMGNGDYQLVQTTSNGRIYEWISPVNGVSQGTYRPGIFVPLPNSRQMLNLGAEVKLNENEEIFYESAFSRIDRNLFSSIEDSDNSGMGYYGGIRSQGRKSFIPKYNWSSSLQVEYDTRNFSFIDRYRSIEFDRNWDLRVDTIGNIPDLIVFGKASLEKDRFNVLSYEVNKRERKGLMSGLQQKLAVNQSLDFFRLTSSYSYLSGTQGTFDSDWLETSTDLSFRKFKIISGYIHEINENRFQQQDSVVNSRMHYRSHEFYLTSNDSSSSQFRASYTLRKDKLPVSGVMEDFLDSRNFKLSYSKAGARNNWITDFNYRSTNDNLGLNTGEGEIISGRINWLGNYLKNSIRHNFSFSTGNSRELRREFVYLPVITGEGTHTWRDQNGDGVQDLNEFFEAINPDERNYVKIFTPTDDYLTSFQSFYIHTIDVKMPFSWRKQGGVKAFISKFSMNANFNINYRTTSDNYNDRLNPFSVKLDDASLLSAQDQKRYTLFFNRNGRGLAGDFSLRTSNNKQLLTQGFELREKQDWIANFKIDLSSEYTFRLTSTFGNFSNESDFLDSRNFRILTDTYEPQLIWQPSSSVRVVGRYQRESKRNDFLETSKESSLIQRYSGELTWNKRGKGSLRSTFALVNIDFTGDQSTYLAYLLLDALQPGSNQTWQINWQQKMSKGMQLSLIYNGRKSEDTRAIHTGNVQVTAYF